MASQRPHCEATRASCAAQLTKPVLGKSGFEHHGEGGDPGGSREGLAPCRAPTPAQLSRRSRGGETARSPWRAPALGRGSPWMGEVT